MDYIMSAGGLLVHSRMDWPCAVCRPQHSFETKGLCLCVHCARRFIAAAEAGMESARALLPDITEALVHLDAPIKQTYLTAN